MHCPGGNATDPIWRVLASSLGISSWTPLKPQHSNPNPLANQLWCIDFLTPTTPLIPHRLPGFLESLMPLKNWCSIHARWSKSSLKHSIGFYGIFSKHKTILLHIILLKCQIAVLKFTSCDNQVLVGCIPIAAVAVHLNLKSKIGQSSHKMYRNNSEFSRVYDNFKYLYKKVWKLIECTIYIYIYKHTAVYLKACS